jgi:hypothetical protein
MVKNLSVKQVYLGTFTAAFFLGFNLKRKSENQVPFNWNINLYTAGG